MLVGRMAGHQIQQDMHPAPVGFPETAFQVVVGSIARRHLFVVAHVVSGIPKRGIEARVDPDGVAAERPDVIELSCNSVDVADSVSVGIIKTLRVDFIKNGVVQPVRHRNPLFAIFSPDHWQKYFVIKIIVLSLQPL